MVYRRKHGDLLRKANPDPTRILVFELITQVNREGAFTIFLNYLCERGLGVVSWIIVFVPFILMSIIISVLLLTLGVS